jgi:hypothetical protein
MDGGREAVEGETVGCHWEELVGLKEAKQIGAKGIILQPRKWCSAIAEAS